MANKNIKGSKIYKRISLFSAVGIVGIIAWCTISLDMGSQGMNASLLLIVFLLVLVSCFSALASSEEKLKEKFKNSRKELAVYNKRKIIIFIATSTLGCYLFSIVFPFKSILTSFFITMGVCYPILCIGIIISNILFAKRISNKVRNDE